MTEKHIPRKVRLQERDAELEEHLREAGGRIAVNVLERGLRRGLLGLLKLIRRNRITIKGFINSWKEFGKVPRKNVKSVESKFRKLIDSFFEQLDMDKAEKRDIQFRSKIEAIVAEDDKDRLSEELFKLQQGAKKCKEELSLLENNISFFKNAKDDNPLLKEVRKNIERQKEKFEEIKTRMAYIRSL